MSTDEIIARTDAQYRVVANSLANNNATADSAPPLLEAILADAYDGAADEKNVASLFGEEEGEEQDEPHRGLFVYPFCLSGASDAVSSVRIAGVAFSHKTTTLVGEDQTEKQLATTAMRALADKQRSAVEKKSEANPGQFDEQVMAFLRRRSGH